MLSQEDRQLLIDIARKSLDQYVRQTRILTFDGRDFSDELMRKAGAFVTLQKNGKLRGCMGRFRTSDPLYLLVRDMAISAATRDTRFSEVTRHELNDIYLDISVLTEPVRIGDISEIELGRHGIYIIKEMSSGTFLPEVAEKTGWDLEQFLGHCSRDKAHIGWYGWKDAEIYTYETESFGEPSH